MRFVAYFGGKRTLPLQGGHKTGESIYVRFLMRKHPGSNILRSAIRHDKLCLHSAVTEEIDLS
jgi:hypothetical protein